MVLCDIFQPGERVELIDGVIVDMSPQKSFHSVTTRLVEDALRVAFATGYDVRVQMPLALDETSEPEPDVAVVPGRARDYTKAHPATAVLVVEVADSSLNLDRKSKQALYARNGIAEYWVVNLQDNSLEVYRDPHQDRYRFQTVLRGGDTVRLLARPDHAIAVADLLP
jgi:Uma2 family endonuclease